MGEGRVAEPHMTPSCWKIIRAYARGMRSLFMAAAQRLLEGPLQPCRIAAKLDRWSARIAPFIQADIDNQPPRYPARYGAQTLGYWRDQVAQLRQDVDAHLQTFKDQVSCDRHYNVDDWDPIVRLNLNARGLCCSYSCAAAPRKCL